MTYVNCGDWVESCTAVVEHYDGRLEIIEWVTTNQSFAAGTVEVEKVNESIHA